MIKVTRSSPGGNGLGVIDSSVDGSIDGSIYGSMATQSERAHVYNIAGQSVVFENQVASLSAYEEDQSVQEGAQNSGVEKTVSELPLELFDKSNADLKQSEVGLDVG